MHRYSRRRPVVHRTPPDSGAPTALGSHLCQAQGSELGPLLAELDRLVTAGEAGRVAVLGEAMARGETGTAGMGGPGGTGATSAAQWLRHWAPSLRTGGAGTVAVAAAFTK